MEITNNLYAAIDFRRSIRRFDKEKSLPEGLIKKCLQQATLAPNSSNMQLYEFYHITSPAILKKMERACLNQNAAKTAKEMVVVVVRKDLWKKRTRSNINHIVNFYGIKNPNEYSKRQKFAISYYKKIMPFVYSEFLGLYGILKYLLSIIIGQFKPIYRQVRKSDMRIVAHKSAGLAAQTFMLCMASEGYDTCPMEGIDSLRIKRILNLSSKSEINMVISCGKRVPEGVYGDRFRIPFDNVYFQC